MNKPFQPSAPSSVRAVFAAAALAATLAVAGFIDYLAASYQSESQQVVKSQPVIVAAKH